MFYLNDDPEYIKTQGKHLYVAFQGQRLEGKHVVFTTTMLSKVLKKNSDQRLADWISDYYIIPPPMLEGAFQRSNNRLIWKSVYFLDEACIMAKYYKLRREYCKHFRKDCIEHKIMIEEIERVRLEFKRNFVYGRTSELWNQNS